MRGEREEAHGNLNCGRYTDRFAGFICFQEHRNRNTPREQEQVHGSHLGTRHAMFIGCSCVFLVGFTQEHPENTQEHVKNAIGDTTPHVPRCVPLRTRARGTGEQSPLIPIVWPPHGAISVSLVVNSLVPSGIAPEPAISECSRLEHVKQSCSCLVFLEHRNT